MLRRRHLLCLVSIACALIAGCSRTTDKNAPLAYVPADTPYVYANLKVPPKDVTQQWSARMHEYLPAMLPVYEDMLDRLDATLAKTPDPVGARVAKLARIFVDEIKTHDDWDKLRQIGLKPDALFTFYGIGLTPVARVQLDDAAAFKAEVARIETRAGEKLPVGSLDKQAYWHVDYGKFQVLIAVEGKQLVATLAPAQADDPLKRSLLGLTRPKKSLADSGDLSSLADNYDYSPYGEGFVDFTRIVDRLTGPAKGTDRQAAKLLGLPTGGIDATCHKDFERIADNFRRLVVGARELGTRRVRIGAQLEMQPDLAKALMAALSAAPGSAADGEGVVDIGVSLPLIKLKDFMIAQADAVAAKPFGCASLGLNGAFARLKSKLDITIPPPFSDMSGVRFVLDKATASDHGLPQVEGRVLFATSNPKADLAMAQLTVPALKNLELKPDGKPVALPAGLAPRGFPPLYAAMSDKAIAVGAGNDAKAGLDRLMSAPAADKPVFLRMHFSSAFYALMADFMRKTGKNLPPEAAKRLQMQAGIFTIYQNWFRSGELSMTANAKGIALEESIQQN